MKQPEYRDNTSPANLQFDGSVAQWFIWVTNLIVALERKGQKEISAEAYREMGRLCKLWWNN